MTSSAATAATRSPGGGPRRTAGRGPDRSLIALAAVLTGAAALLIGFGWQLSFFLDDWTFLLYRRGSFTEVVLEPHNQNVVAGLAAVYRLLAEAFGISSAVPFRAVLVALVVLTSVLLFWLVRARVGGMLAVLAVACTALLGAAYEDLLWPIQIGYFICIACGLGSFLALARRTRGGDALACALLIVAVLTHSTGIPFVFGAAALVALDADRWRRVWVIAGPVAAYGLWWLGWGHDAESTMTLTNIASSPIFALDGFASSLSSLLGLSTPRPQEAIGALAWGRPLLAIAAAIAVWRVHRLGRVPPWLLVFGATAAAFWLLAGFNESAGREPTASRYQYIGAVFIILLAAELAAGVRMRRGVLAVIAVIALAAVVSNISYLEQSRDSYLRITQLERAGLGALEIARDSVDPQLHLSQDLVETPYVFVSAERYLNAVDEYGSPAYTPEEIATAPEHARAAADRTLAAAVGLTFTPRDGAARDTGSAPRPLGDTAASTAGACTTIDLERGTPVALELAPGGVDLQALRPGRTEVRLRRYASESFPVPAGTLNGPGTVELAIAGDRADEPWELALVGNQRVRACGLGA